MGIFSRKKRDSGNDNYSQGYSGDYHYDPEEEDNTWEEAGEILEITNDPDFDEWDELGQIPHTPLKFDRDDEDGPITGPIRKR